MWWVAGLRLVGEERRRRRADDFLAEVVWAETGGLGYYSCCCFGWRECQHLGCLVRVEDPAAVVLGLVAPQ